MTSKADLRRAMRERLRLEEPSRLERSQALCRQLVVLPAYAEAKAVAIFDPMPSEPAIDLLWDMAPRRFLYPRVEGTLMRLVTVKDPADLLAPAHGFPFREPAITDATTESPRVVLIPGLAFTRDGHRLGRGGGYYDRLLSGLPKGTVRIGVCFAFQLMDHLPIEPHDERVHFIATEGAIFA